MRRPQRHSHRIALRRKCRKAAGVLAGQAEYVLKQFTPARKAMRLNLQRKWLSDRLCYSDMAEEEGFEPPRPFRA